MSARRQDGIDNQIVIRYCGIKCTTEPYNLHTFRVDMPEIRFLLQRYIYYLNCTRVLTHFYTENVQNFEICGTPILTSAEHLFALTLKMPFEDVTTRRRRV